MLPVMAENLLLLRAVETDGQLRRLFSIMHMRFSDHDHQVHEYTFEAGHGMRMQGAAPPGAIRAEFAGSLSQDGRARGMGSRT